MAKGLGIKTIALTGKDGGELAQKADIVLNVESQSTPRIQEVHITICHTICQLIDHFLFQKGCEMKIKPLSSKGIRTYSIRKRKSKVSVADLAKIPERGGTFRDFFDSLPDILGAKDFKDVVAAIVLARKKKDNRNRHGRARDKDGLEPTYNRLDGEGRDKFRFHERRRHCARL